MSDEIKTVDLVVLGGGPGGYTAAFRAADLGLRTAIVERYDVLGGVCLNVGCVPSKALLHAASLIEGVQHFHASGVMKTTVSCDIDGLRKWKDEVVGNLNNGLSSLAKRRKIDILNGRGSFVSPNQIEIKSRDGVSTIQFTNAIVATGSHSAKLPFLPDDDSIWDSTDALRLSHVPTRLLVLGGGVIGLEMATVYQALGSDVSIVELADSILPGIDKTTVRPLFLSMKKKCTIYTDTKAVGVKRTDDLLKVALEGKKCPEHLVVDAILVSVGRRPNVDDIGLESIGIALDDQKFIQVDEQCRTSVPHIFAIGDVTRGSMLAHRASADGRVAAEVAAGLSTRRSYRAIPQVAYTHPEVATVGLSEMAATAEGISVGIGKFPFAASARAMTIGESAGFSKLIFNAETDEIIGAELVGAHAGELIAEAVVAIQNGLTVKQLTAAVHPHPSLSESTMMAAEVFEGTVTDLFIPKRS